MGKDIEEEIQQQEKEEERAEEERTALEKKDPKAFERNNEANLKEYFKTRNLDLRNEIFADNRGLVVSIAMKYYKDFCDRSKEFKENLLQEGDLALIDAIEHFDPTMKNQLSTYATPYILNAMRNYINEVFPSIKIPAKVRQKLFAYDKAESYLTNLYSRKPTSQEIADYLNDGTTAEDIDNARAGAYYASALSLQSKLSDKDGDEKDAELSDLQAADEDDPAEVAAKNEQQEVLKDAINTLDEREKDILISRSALSEKQVTLATLAKKYGISIERTRQIEEGAEKKIKKYMDTHLG